MFATVGAPAGAPAAAPAAPATQPTSGPKLPVALPVIPIASWFTSRQGLFGAAYTIMFYTAVTAFVLFLLLTTIHFTIYPIFSFSPEDDGIITIPTASDRQKAFINTVARFDEAAPFESVPDCSYTLSMDIYLSGDFQNTRAPRVLLYRAAAPVTVTSTDSRANLLEKYSSTNLLVWLDETKNDLYVTAVTSAEGSSVKNLETTRAIENVPIRKPFSVSVVFTDKFLEVYMDGKLEQSLAIKARPIAQPTTQKFYSVPQFFQYSVKTANISFWPRALSASAIRANGGAIADKTLFSPTQS